MCHKRVILFCHPLSEPAQLDGVGQLRSIVTPGEPLKEDVMHFLLMPTWCLQKEGHSLRERKTTLLSLAPSTVKTWYSYSVQMPKLSGWSCIHSDCIRLNTFVNNIYIHLWSLWFQAWRKVRIHAITHIHLWTSELKLGKWKGTLKWKGTPKENEKEGFQCLEHSNWTICIPLNHFCSENFPSFSLS